MDQNRLREISILVDSLDMDRADKLLEKLPPETQQQVRQAVVMLDDVSEAERKEVIDRFLGRTKTGGNAGAGANPSQPAVGNATPSGVYQNPRSVNPLAGNPEATGQGSAPNSSVTDAPKNSRSSLPPELAQKLGIKQKDPNNFSASQTQPSSAPSFVEPPIGDKPTVSKPVLPAEQPEPNNQASDFFQEIDSADVDCLAEVVLKESPQFVAVVLSILSADKSVQLLELFPDHVQGDILKRLETLDHVDEEILDEISRRLREVVQRRSKLKSRQSSGRVAIAKILSAAQRAKSGVVVGKIQDQLLPASETHAANLDQSAEKRQTSNHTQLVGSAATGSYQYSPSGNPVGAVSTGQPGFFGSQDQAFHSEGNRTPRKQLEAGLEQKIEAARRQIGGRGHLDPSVQNEELSPAEALLNRESQGDTSSNRIPRTASELENSLLTDEVDSVQGFEDQPVKISFEKLQKCDKASLQALLATAKPKLTLLALRGAPPALTKRVLKMLPKNEAKEVQFRIQNMGPTRLQDIEEAQNYLLRLASLLEKLGRFRFPRGIFG